MSKPQRDRRGRLAGAIVAGLASLVVFATMGGVGLAKDAIGLVQYQYGKKVTICHKQKNTIRVSVNAWKAHQRNHGDTLGTCAQAKAKKLKAAKIKAAKIKAARAEAQQLKQLKADLKAKRKAAKQAGKAGKAAKQQAKAAERTAKQGQSLASGPGNGNGNGKGPGGNGNGNGKGPGGNGKGNGRK